MIGGAPVSQGFADEIGADGYSDNANTAVAVAKELIGNKKNRIKRHGLHGSTRLLIT